MIIVKNNNGKYYLNAVEIDVTKYNDIQRIIRNKPTAPDGYTYILTESLEWKLVMVEIPNIEDTMPETEQKAAAYDILTGVSK